MWSTRSCGTEARSREMDFATRDRYRKAIEELARGTSLTEAEVAHKAVDMAHAAATDRTEQPVAEARHRDPGFYLISDGRNALEPAPSACTYRSSDELDARTSAIRQLATSARW